MDKGLSIKHNIEELNQKEKIGLPVEITLATYEEEVPKEAREELKQKICVEVLDWEDSNSYWIGGIERIRRAINQPGNDDSFMEYHVTYGAGKRDTAAKEVKEIEKAEGVIVYRKKDGKFEVSTIKNI
jgi:hypothetical protein